jgi:hypothetical protein
LVAWTRKDLLGQILLDLGLDLVRVRRLDLMVGRHRERHARLGVTR